MTNNSNFPYKKSMKISGLVVKGDSQTQHWHNLDLHLLFFIFSFIFFFSSSFQLSFYLLLKILSFLSFLFFLSWIFFIPLSPSIFFSTFFQLLYKKDLLCDTTQLSELVGLLGMPSIYTVCVQKLYHAWDLK